jgi:hypothetical protein
MLIALLTIKFHSLAGVNCTGHPAGESETQKHCTGVGYSCGGVVGSEQCLAFGADASFDHFFELGLFFHDGFVGRLLNLSHHDYMVIVMKYVVGEAS